MTVLVTGAGGLTGSEIARRLVRAGRHVVAVSRRPADVPGATIVTGDCGDAAVMGAYLSDAESVVHVAGIIEGERIARLPRIGDVRLVVVSSAGVYSAHRISAKAYLAGERAIAAANGSAVVVRPTMIYGSARDRNIHHVIRFAQRFGVLPLIGRGDAQLQPIHFEDLAAAVVALVRTDRSGTIDAAGGAPISLRALLTEVFAALDRPPRLVRLPVGPSRAAARLADALRGGRLAERVARMAEERTADIAELVSVTTITPRTFQTGVRDQIAAMRRDGGLDR